MNIATRFYQLAVQKLGFRQRAYQVMFGEGGPAHLVLVDLADYSRAFAADAEGLTDGQIREMYGRRQMFFRIIHHLKLTSLEIEAVYRPVLIRAASRLQTSQGADE